MPKRKLNTGEKGWIGLVAYIIAVDGYAWRNQLKGKNDETMSLSWGRWLQHPSSRTATGIAWAVVTLHLFLSMPLPGGKTIKKVVTYQRRNGKIAQRTIVLPKRGRDLIFPTRRKQALK